MNAGYSSRPMTYRLSLNDLDCGVAADQYAIGWRDTMQKRYRDDHVRIEPESGAEPTFPVGEEDEGDRFDPMAVATVRCPRCDAVISFSGFEAMLAYSARTATVSSRWCRR